MGVKNFIKKSVAFVSAVAMACSMVVMPAGASYAEEADSGLNLNKTVELQQDGTYKITLNSYATGEYTTVTERSGTPLDIVLVLDQSGSMDSDVDSLRTAVTNFVKNISDNANEYNVNHRIALVGYASKGSDYNDQAFENTGLFIDGTLKRYGTQSDDSSTQLTNNDYQKALVNVNTDGAITNSITTAISNISAYGCTYTDYGLKMANGIFENNPLVSGSNRKRIVVVFTDGQPGHSGYEESTACDAVNNAYETKNTYGATVYSVGFYSNPSDNVKNFMNYISSNYPEAKCNKTRESTWYFPFYKYVYEFVPGTQIGTKYYMQATDQTALGQVFENISNDVETPNTTVKLDENAVTRDIITDKLDISDNTKVTAYTEDYKGGNTWQKSATQVALTTTINKDTKTVDVTGFDYAANFVDLTKSKGQRLVVEITGLTANQAGDNMITNVTDKSGVYANSETENPSETFNEFSITIPSKSYVLDYGKTVVSNTIQADCGISKVDFCNTVKPSPYETSTNGTYGTFDLTNVSNGGTISYTPGKINWDGFDSAYVFGAVSNGYLWSAVNFIPATSVYYEDDFGTEAQSDSNVSIVWSDGWNTEKDKESSKDNSQSSVNQQYGWDESYVDDTQSSNGSSHWSTTQKATATFRFTGTAVDIYSRTNKDVGRIIGRIKKVNDDGTTTGIKTMTIDNLSESSGSGSYYQIPTLFFDGLDYGTYEVTITVNPIKDSEGNVVRAKYYLDGVRVYHPLNPDKLDPIASDAYDEANESNAKYITLRNDLIDAKTSTEITSRIEGAVFIDKSPDTDINDIGIYEDYGPKNEVYLANGNGVAFTVDGYNADTDKVFVGLKSITGKETNVSITGETSAKSISSAADLYYEVKPDSNGNVVITNNTDNILSVTKVRITTKSGVKNTRMLVATPQLMSYAANFELSEDTTQTDTDLDEGDVDIDNPSDNDSTQEDNTQTEEQPSTSIWQQILNSLNKWFRR